MSPLSSPVSRGIGDDAPPKKKTKYTGRKHPAHHPPFERHNKPTTIFLAICTYHRRKILTNAHTHEAILNAWKASKHWTVGRYVIMPDHIHLFCSPATRDAVSAARWTTYWKRLVSQHRPELQPMWQRDCWDTQLRHHESYSEKWEYVCNNPVRAGLVADDWPYQGIVNHLQW